MVVVIMKQLFDSGIYFGYQICCWNFKMKCFIFIDCNGIYIIDLQQMLIFIDKVYEFVKEIVVYGGLVFFVGIKKQVQELVVVEVIWVGMLYVNQCWLGGMFINFFIVYKWL